MRRATIPILALAALLFGGAPAGAATAPGALAKALRALGLQSPPGPLGDKAYRKGDYEEAVRQYGRAAEEADSVPPLLDRNLGNALYRQKRYAEAADYYGRALKKSGAPSGLDTAFAASAHYDLGNALYRKAEGADSTRAQEAMADLREALAHYKKALRLGRSAGDKALEKDSRRNLEVANARLQKLLDDRKKNPPQGEPPPPPEPDARAKEALARALQFAQERRYDEAAAVLDAILKSDKTAASFASHRKRLDDVIRILHGEKPSDPSPRDPRAVPWNPGPPGGRTP